MGYSLSLGSPNIVNDRENNQQIISESLLFYRNTSDQNINKSKQLFNGIL